MLVFMGNPFVRLRTHDGVTADVPPGGLIGRLPGAALRLDDPLVSEAHALVSLRGRKLKLLALRLNKLSKQFSDETGKAVTGNLSMIGPTELIQAITVTSRTGELRIAEGEKFIEIFFHEGQLWRIRASRPDPEEAFYDFLTWEQGQFGFQPHEKPPEGPREFHKDTTSLLLEGMRRLDVSSATHQALQ